MSRDPGPTDCCTYECNQGRFCPARCDLNTTDGGQQIDTCSELDSVYGWVDQVIHRGRLAALAFAAIFLSLAIFYFFY